MPEATAQDGPVVIVGGGWAGLTAAIELCDAGIPVILLEAARQLGGRARSVRFDDLVVDNGQHLLTGACRSLLALLDRVGIATDRAFDRLPLTLHCVAGDKLSLHLKAPALPAPLHLAAAFIKARGLSFQDKLQALRFARRLAHLDIAAETDISVQALLHSQQQTPALIGKLWEPLCIAVLNTPVGEASARVFVRVLRESFAQRRQYSELLIPRLELGNLLPTPACEYLETHGARVLLGQRVTALNISAGRVHGIRVRDQEIPARHVILATPHIISRRLMSGQPALESLCADLAQLGNEPVTTVYLQYPAPVRLPCAMTGLHGGLVQWVFDRSQTGTPGLVAAVISARGEHLHLDSDTLATRTAAELSSAFPGWPQHVKSLVIREKRATFSSRTGIDTHRPANGTPVTGLWLAGDYTAVGLPSTLEGAVRSGIGCAREVIASIEQTGT